LQVQQRELCEALFCLELSLTDDRTVINMTGTSTPSNIDDKVIPNDPDGLQKFLNDNDINLQWLLDHDQEASVRDETPADNSCE